MTVRKQIIAELENAAGSAPMTARELSKTIRISEKEVIAHLEHVARSLHLPRRLVLDPPVCNKCGFVFTDRQRFSIPSRCPDCRHEGIQPPAFTISAD